MIVFSNKFSPRLAYITDFIGRELFNQPLQVTTDESAFKSFAGPRINYSDQPITGDEFRIHPHSLLFEEGIHEPSISCFKVNRTKAFFKTQGDIPFDILAAAFYLLSRYEEYLPHQKDEYGRYAHQNSLAFREKFLDLPLINIWLQEFGEALKNKFPSLLNSETRISKPESRFKFIPTYDIDEAYAYLHKSWWKTAGGMMKSLLNGKFSELPGRREVFKGKNVDPYDCYDWLNRLHEKYRLRPIYFFHAGLKKGKYDKNISLSKPAMQDLIQQHAEKYEIGIHPSWKSNESPELLKYEILKLTHVSGKPITASRQHYIKLSLPETYRLLIEDGIQHDFSVGYGSINGFRASVASPFYWYDLQKETTTSLLLHPFCFMDANSFFEQKHSPGEALEEMLEFARKIKSTGGTMITVWHNTILGTSKMFQGWRECYEEFVRQMAAGRISNLPDRQAGKEQGF